MGTATNIQCPVIVATANSGIWFGYEIHSIQPIGGLSSVLKIGLSPAMRIFPTYRSSEIRGVPAYKDSEFMDLVTQGPDNGSRMGPLVDITLYLPADTIIYEIRLVAAAKWLSVVETKIEKSTRGLPSEVYGSK